MIGFKLASILIVTVLTLVSASFITVKNMTASHANTRIELPSPTPTPEPSVSVSPSPSLTPSPSAKPSVKPSVAPTIKPSPSASSSTNPSPTVIITTTTTTTTTQTNNDPKINSLDPSNPAFGAPMTIKGENFGNQTATINIYNANGEPQPYSPPDSWSDTEIKTHSPFFASDMEYQVEIVTADGRRSNRLTVKSGGGQPQLDNISPSGVKPGDELTITGSRYDSNPGRVDFFQNYPNISGTGTIVSWSETEIKVKVPSNLEAGKEYGIQVTNGRGGQSSFKYYTLGS